MIDKIKAYGFQALALALLALSIYLGFQLYEAQLSAEKARGALSAEKTSRAQENTERMRVALDDARATFRRNEIHARNQQEIADAHAKQERARAAALAAAAADGERLRDQIRAFAAACGGGEAQSVAAAILDCRDRAATLGELYEAADRQAGDFAAAAEKHADEVRTLKRVIENDRALLLPPGGVGLKPPPRPVAGLTH